MRAMFLIIYGGLLGLSRSDLDELKAEGVDRFRGAGVYHAAMPTDAERSRDADVIVAFHMSRAKLEAAFDRLRAGMHDAGGLWIAWPKRTASSSGSAQLGS